MPAIVRLKRFLVGDDAPLCARATHDSSAILDPTTLSKVKKAFAEIRAELTDLWEVIERHQEQIRKYQLRIARDTYVAKQEQAEQEPKNRKPFQGVPFQRL